MYLKFGNSRLFSFRIEYGGFDFIVTSLNYVGSRSLYILNISITIFLSLSTNNKGLFVRDLNLHS